MAAAAAASAAARGARVGALMGTAYLFTREAVQAGAITERFQNAALAAERDRAAGKRTGPRHALPGVAVRRPFTAERRRLEDAGADPEQRRMELEALNIGRLRIAAKGVDRLAGANTGADTMAAEAASSKPELVAVSEQDQWERGMYMIGQVAALRDSVTTIAELHREVSDGAAEAVGNLRSESARPARAPEPPPPADVAIIGVGCILPGAPEAESFWANILDKVDAIREIPPERWDWRQMFDPDPATRPTRSTRAGAASSTRSRSTRSRSACRRSRCSRSSRSSCWRCCAPRRRSRTPATRQRPFDRERTSVILGAGGGGADTSVGYTVRSALPSLFGGAHPELQEQLFERLPEWTEDSFAGLLMNVAAGRIANRLDLGGTNYTVDAACASSLARDRPRRARAADGHQRHGAGRRRRRDPEPLRLPLLRQDAGALADRPLPARSTPPPTGSPSARASRPSCSSAWPTPSATATASTP